jgi:TRAP-type mannitol/chloroaromatic compound transport system permease small subunit
VNTVGRDGIATLDAITAGLGRAVGWLTLSMVLATLLVVVMRYGFDAGWLWLQESITWMHACVFMFGAAWALRRGDHVRVDVFYKTMSPRGQAIVDLAGTLLLLLPLCGYLLWQSWPYALQSWQVGETSREAGGMRALWALKAVIPLATTMLILQGVSEATRAGRRLRGRAGAGDGTDDTAATRD